MKSNLMKVMKILGVYFVSWHISFVIMFISRGDSISWDLYQMYFHFIYTPGLMIPTFIQVFAISMTVIFFVCGGWKLMSKRKNSTESSILPPTDVSIERTNDVNENIRRYKEAQEAAVEKIRLNNNSV